MRKPLRNYEFNQSDYDDISQQATIALIYNIGPVSKSHESDGIQVAMTGLENAYLDYRLQVSGASQEKVEQNEKAIKTLTGNQHGKIIIGKIYEAIDDAIDEKLGSGRSR